MTGFSEAMYPVDLPAVDDTDLTSASEQYLSSLESNPHNNEVFQPSQMSKVEITTNNVRRLRLFEDDQPDCTLLALHPPDDPTQVVAVYLHEEWWCVDDVLRTSSESRSGLMLVQSIMERVIVFLLSQVVERSTEKEEVLFCPHPRTESCKLLWRDGQVVGFYTVKHKGSLCDSWTSQAYLLPVLDTVLVRKSCRRRGFGLQMLEDFCSSFCSEKFLGVSCPLSPSMAAVCRRFLQQHEDQRERLYEVEAPGGWTQRRNIWLNIQLGRYSLGVEEMSRPTSGETQRKEGDDDSAQELKIQLHNCGLDLTSSSTCDVNTAPAISFFSQQQVKPCDPSQAGGEGGGSSQSGEILGTGCSPAANTNASDLDSGRPVGPTQSQNTKRALISKPCVSAEPHREKPEEESQRRAKRVRRT